MINRSCFPSFCQSDGLWPIIPQHHEPEALLGTRVILSTLRWVTKNISKKTVGSTGSWQCTCKINQVGGSLNHWDIAPLVIGMDTQHSMHHSTTLYLFFPFPKGSSWCTGFSAKKEQAAADPFRMNPCIFLVIPRGYHYHFRTFLPAPSHSQNNQNKSIHQSTPCLICIKLYQYLSNGVNIFPLCSPWEIHLSSNMFQSPFSTWITSPRRQPKRAAFF